MSTPTGPLSAAFGMVPERAPYAGVRNAQAQCNPTSCCEIARTEKRSMVNGKEAQLFAIGH